MEKIKDVHVRKDGAVVVDTKKKITVLLPDGDAVVINAKTGKWK